MDFRQHVLAHYSLAMSRGIRKDEIPPEYRDLPIIGRGNTSLILEKSADTVVMLTRDSMKKDWLHFGIGISKDWKIFDVPAKDKKFDQFAIYAIELPKLHKPDAANREKINKEMKFFDQCWKDLHLNALTAKDKLNEMIEYYEQHEMGESMIARLLEFLQNYNPEQYSWDVARRQFLQDAKGDLVLVDPIVNKELIDAMFKRTKPQSWDY